MSIPLHVLFVEDQEEDMMLIARELKRAGMAVMRHRVDNAADLRSALANGGWDVVISDYSMPQFSALDALQIVREAEVPVPFIIVSGVMGEQTAVDALRAGANDFFLKNNVARLPVAVEREVREALARRKHRANSMALREMQARFNAFMDASPMPSWIKDSSGRYLHANPALALLYGVGAGQLTGQRDADLVSPGQASALAEHEAQMLRAGAPLHKREMLYDANHMTRTFDVVRFPVQVEQGSAALVGGMAVDITEFLATQELLEQAIERQKMLSSRVIEVQERERAHLSRGLHDDIGQSLTALKIGLEGIQKAGSLQGSALADAIGIVGSVLEQVRSLSLDLRPPQLDSLGLVATLRAYLESRARAGGFASWFESGDLGSGLHPDIETTCFRVAQEVLTNILRHAKARNVWLEISRQGARLRLCIRDDGVGYDPDAAHSAAVAGKSSGLLNMEERTLLVGGQLEIKSAPGQGTTTELFLPVQPTIPGGHV